MNRIHVNTFATRQTPESRFSHYTGTWQELAALVADAFASAKPGYREGVVKVPVNPAGFFSGIVQLNEGDKLSGTFEARRDGEEPRKSVGPETLNKIPAKSVDIVLYASTVLAEEDDNNLEPVAGNWEIISINANPFEGKMPIHPEVLMHNHFGSTGGTDTNLSDAEFVAMLRESFEAWKDKA
jgi:hypothetical protein